MAASFDIFRNYTSQTSGMAVNCEAGGLVNSAVSKRGSTQPSDWIHDLTPRTWSHTTQPDI